MLKLLCTVLAISLTLSNGHSLLDIESRSKLFQQLAVFQRGVNGGGDHDRSEMHSGETIHYELPAMVNLLKAMVKQINANDSDEQLKEKFHELVSEANGKLDTVKTNLTTGVKESPVQLTDLVDQINMAVKKFKCTALDKELQEIKTTLNKIEVQLEQLHSQLNNTDDIEARLKKIEEFGLTPTEDNGEQIKLLTEVLSKLKSQDEKILQFEENASKLDELFSLLDSLKEISTK